MLTPLRRCAAVLLLTLPLSACDSGVPEGQWINVYDPEDRIEITSSSAATVTAVFGEQLDFWPSAASAATDLGQQFADARRALMVFQRVEVSYRYEPKTGEVVFTSDTRGTRSLIFNKGDMMDDPSKSLRAYLLQK